MDLAIGTFNLNNLFSRFNFYTEAQEEKSSTEAAAATGAPRPWLIPGEALQERSFSSAEDVGAKPPNVEVVTRGEIGTDGRVYWERRYKGKLILGKPREAQHTLARRIKELEVDVLAVQEVEDLNTLGDFVEGSGLRDAGFRHLVLVEGNDAQRLIDVGVISKAPIGAVTSWRHRVHPEVPDEPIFSRDLLQVEILEPSTRTPILTLFVNHLKSQVGDKSINDERRRRQAETILAVRNERTPTTPHLILGDMNDSPANPPLAAFSESDLIPALDNAVERGGPYPSDDPTPPPAGVPWTHRFREEGRTRYELYDQIWASRDLEGRIQEAWILRRTSRGGDASDHDPAAVRLTGLAPTN